MNHINDPKTQPDRDGLDWGTGKTIRPLFEAFALCMIAAGLTGLGYWLIPKEWNWNGSQVALIVHLATGALAILLYSFFIILHQPRKENGNLLRLLLPWRMLQKRPQTGDDPGAQTQRRLGHALHWTMLILIATCIFYAVPMVAFKLGHVWFAGYEQYLTVNGIHLFASLILFALALVHIPLKRRNGQNGKKHGSTLVYRWIWQSVFASFLVGTIFLLTPLPESAGIDPDKLSFYSRPFGSDPFYPAEWKTTDGKLVNWRSASTQTAKYCGDCHKKEFREWASSLHAITGPDIIYDSSILVNEWESKHGGKQRTEKIRWCDSCHEPIKVLAGGRTPLSTVRESSVFEEGATCVLCHSITQVTPLAGNAAMTSKLSEIYNYLDPALIMAAPARHAQDMQAKRDNPLMGRSEFCGACHTEIRPTAVNGQFPIHLQETYDEWRRSSYAARGIECQDCHMSSNPAATIADLKAGQPVKKELSHRFVGNNYLLTDTSLPYLILRGGHPPGKGVLFDPKDFKVDLAEQNTLVLQLLRSAANIRADILPVNDAGQSGIEVHIHNSGAGHALPTGPLDQRYLWVEIKATDTEGKILYHSGWYDHEQDVEDPNAIKYIKYLYDDDDQLIKRHNLFDVKRMEYSRHPIAAGATDTIIYRFPENVRQTQGPVLVEIKLWYRLALKEILQNVRSQIDPALDAKIPPVEIASTKIVLNEPAGKTSLSHTLPAKNKEGQS